MLLSALRKYNYKILWKMHPGFRRYKDDFDLPPEVQITEMSYNKLYAESIICLTDYSSAHFDFAYLRKPCLYYQFDYEFFNQYHLQNAYFDYEKMGFGEVAYSQDEVLEYLIRYMKNDIKQMEEHYVKRVDDFFIYNDKNSSKRAYDAILQKMTRTN